jgi:hypothetical protein
MQEEAVGITGKPDDPGQKFLFNCPPNISC